MPITLFTAPKMPQDSLLYAAHRGANVCVKAFPEADSTKPADRYFPAPL